MKTTPNTGTATSTRAVMRSLHAQKYANKSAEELRVIQTAIADRIINGDDSKAVYSELYTALYPLVYRTIARLGCQDEEDDLFQELYFSMTRAVDLYRNPETHVKYAFQSIAITQFHNAACTFMYRWNGSKTVNGKIAWRKKHLSLNKTVGGEQGDSQADTEWQDLLLSEDSAEDAAIENIHRAEKSTANIELWAAVEKLPTVQRDAIVAYYKDGVSFAEQSRQLGLNPQGASLRANRGCQKLRENKRVQEITHVYDLAVSYTGSFSFFKNNQMSCVEYTAIKNEEREERAKSRELFVLRDTGCFDGRDKTHLAKMTGVSRNVILDLNKGNRAYRSSCERIATHFGKPLDDMFVNVTPPKVERRHDANCWLKLTDGNIITNVHALSREIHVDREAIRNMRDGGAVRRKTAEKLAAHFGKPVEDMFEPYNPCNQRH